MLLFACPCLWGLEGGWKICACCQIRETLLMNCIFSVFKQELIRDSHSGRVLFLLSIVRDRQRQRPSTWICDSVLHCTISPFTLTLDQPLSLLYSSIQALLFSYHHGYFVFCQNRLFSSPWRTLFFDCHRHSYRPLLHKHVDKWSFVNFVAGDIYSVTKQLLELAPWACFPFSLVIIFLHTSGPWTVRPPMTGGSLKEHIYNCNRGKVS